MPDYQKAKIYKLWSPSKKLVYYGSTTQTLSQRLAEHISKKKNKTETCNSHLVLECDDYKIELLEEYPCNNKQQLCRKEGEYIKNNNCVNNRIAGRTNNEYQKDNKKKCDEIKKKYRDNHKEKIKEYRENHKQETIEYKKSYYENNKQQIKEHNKQRYEIRKQNIAIYKWLTMVGILT